MYVGVILYVYEYTGSLRSAQGVADSGMKTGVLRSTSRDLSGGTFALLPPCRQGHWAGWQHMAAEALPDA